MVKNILITTLLAFNAIIVFPIMGQSLTDREAIIQSLAGKNIDGKFGWRPTDQNLKKLAKDIIMNKETEFTANGLCLVTSALSGDEFDDFNDSFFLNNLIVSLDLKKLINECALVRSHFKRNLYNETSLNKISTLTNRDEILIWQNWTPYYLSFMGFEQAESTFIFIKDNLAPINQIHYKLYGIPNQFDTLELNICLSRIGKLNDTLVIKQLEQQLNSGYSKDYIRYIKSLSKIRTIQSFQKLGELLLSDLNEIHLENRIFIKQAALAAFLVYVKNFPDRSLKIQETINIWKFVHFSKVQGKDYSSDEYMEMAKKWYIENKDNLVLDMDKY